MERYSALVGQRVTAHYRAGRMQFTTAGTLAEDSGEYICLEEHFTQGDRPKTLRICVPYSHLIRLEAEPEKKPSAFSAGVVPSVFHKSFPANKP